MNKKTGTHLCYENYKQFFLQVISKNKQIFI